MHRFGPRLKLQTLQIKTVGWLRRKNGNVVPKKQQIHAE